MANIKKTRWYRFNRMQNSEIFYQYDSQQKFKILQKILPFLEQNDFMFIIHELKLNIFIVIFTLTFNF